MLITVPLSRLLDDLYAASAIRTLRDNSHLLDPDRAPALRRFIIAAAAEVAGSLCRILRSVTLPDPDTMPADSGNITFSIDDSAPASPDALASHISAAVTSSALRLIAATEGDTRRAEAFASLARSGLDTIMRLITAPPPAAFRRHYI